MLVVATCDGGGGDCHEVACYGSVHLRYEDGREELLRLDFPEAHTSNGAEYSAVIAALESLQEEEPEATVLVRSDSRLVIMQCKRKWKIKARHLRPLRDKVLRLAAMFPEVQFQWIPRDEVEELLGH